MECVSFDVMLIGSRLSQYKNYTFNSMVKFGDTFIGAHREGLFKLAGATDNGSKIDAEFTLLSTDLGVRNTKKFHYVYLGLETTDDLQLDVTADEKDTFSYVIKASKTGQQTVRVKIFKTTYGRYWSLKISNPSGGKFAVDSIDVLPIVRNLYHV